MKHANTKSSGSSRSASAANALTWQNESRARFAEYMYGCQPSASRAARRIGPSCRPHTQMGGPPGWAGVGSMSTSRSLKMRPS